MEPHDPDIEIGFGGVVGAGLLGDELLPAVRILGLRGKCVLFLQREDVGVGLPELGIDAGRRRVEVPLDAVLPGSLQGVQVDQGVVVEDLDVIGRDEPHATHVSRQRVDVVDADHRRVAVLGLAQIELQELVRFGVSRTRGGEDRRRAPNALPDGDGSPGGCR